MLAGFIGKLNLHGNKATYDEALRLAISMTLPKNSCTTTCAKGALALAAALPHCAMSLNNNQIICDNNYILTGAGSLYNREELVKLLECSNDVDDLTLMWLTWRQWREKAPLHLDGDWMFAAYDNQSEELLLARSWGHSSLYYHLGKNYIAFATHPSSLTALEEVPSEPDIDFVIKMMCGRPLSPNTTSYRTIYQLQPGAQLKISMGKVCESIWWEPGSSQQIAVTDEQAALDRFVELYEVAVKKRLNTPLEVGATLSAGLDSSSVCVLAARRLETEKKKLHTWTSIPYYLSKAVAPARWLTDESSLAASIVKSAGNICHMNVDAADTDPIEAIRKQLYLTGRPQGAVGNLYWLDKILMLAADSGCGILLTGQLGNNTISWTPDKISLFPKSKYYPNITGRDYLKLFKYRTINQLKKFLRSIKEYRFSLQQEFPLINPKYSSSPGFKKSLHSIWDGVPINHANMAGVHMCLFDTWYHSGFWSGVEVRDPTMDTKLNEFVLSLPDTMFFRDGLNRRVMRLGMQGILPDQVRLNKRRGQQASDIVPRVRQYCERVELALKYIRVSGTARELLNIQQMDLILDRVRKGENGLRIMGDCIRVLLPGLSAGLFLAAYDTDYDFSSPLA